MKKLVICAITLGLSVSSQAIFVTNNSPMAVQVNGQELAAGQTDDIAGKKDGFFQIVLPDTCKTKLLFEQGAPTAYLDMSGTYQACDVARIKIGSATQLNFTIQEGMLIADTDDGQHFELKFVEKNPSLGLLEEENGQ